MRFNNEVNACVVGTFAKPVRDGEEESISDLETITDVELTDRDPNAGHVTLLIHNGSWIGRFDFRYNATISRIHLSTAREFLDAANVSLARGHRRAMLDNLFSATEVMAKGALLLHDDTMRHQSFYELRLAEQKAGKAIKILPTLKKQAPAHP